MAVEYIVEKKVDGHWYNYGKWTDPCKLAVAMWELGLQRPNYEDLRVVSTSTEDKVCGQPKGWVDYLVREHKCSAELAVLALQKNGTSVIHAGAMLASEYERAALEKELRDAR